MSTVLTPAQSPSTGLASIEELKALSQPSKLATSDALAVVSKVGDYLPYISLQSSNSIPVKRGQFPMGHFALIEGKAMTDLGAKFTCLVIAWRPKAMVYDPPESFYDYKSDAFKTIQAKSGEKDAGCGFGPEFLVWLPVQKKFALYFLGNKTGRNESPNLTGPLIEKGPFVCTQEAELIETKKYSWHGPVTKLSDLSIEMPPVDQLKTELEKFKNPPATEKEPVENAASSTRD